METFSLPDQLVSVAHCSELIISSDKSTINDEISSQISAQLFDLCDNDLFPEALQNSDEVTSCSNYCYEENSYPENFTSYQNDSTTAKTTAPTNQNDNDSNSHNRISMSMLFDPQEDMENDISASIDFSPSPQFATTPTEQFGFSPLLASAPLPPVFEEDCMSSVPAYVPMNASSFPCSFLGAGVGPYLPGAPAFGGSGPDGAGGFSSGLLMAELQPQDLDFPGDGGGIYCPDSMQSVFGAGELQGLGNESQQLISGAGNSTSLASEIPNMGEQSFKVGKLSVEQRKEKIHRYMKKRNERNFSKKIKYACRKTLADSRPRVRGRFAKNDDFGEATRAGSSNHDEDDDEEVVVKEEDDMVDSSDIFAHISGVNSFKCNYPIQSWI